MCASWTGPVPRSSSPSSAGAISERRATGDRVAAAAPALFVLFWSSGFVAAKGGLAGAEPLTFLALRFALVTAIMLGLALVLRRPWPRRRRELLHLAVIGLSMQAVYFGTTYQAFAAGIGAGALALILALQPLVTACVAGPFLGEAGGPPPVAGLPARDHRRGPRPRRPPRLRPGRDRRHPLGLRWPLPPSPAAPSTRSATAATSTSGPAASSSTPWRPSPSRPWPSPPRPATSPGAPPSPFPWPTSW